MSDRETKVALLGTGRMGAAIARRLAREGFEVSLWNRTRSRAEKVGVGTVADTPAAAVRGATVVLSILTGPEAVREVYLGTDGALSTGGARYFAEMSTAGPEAVRELEPAVRQRGGSIFDAPVLGSVPAVESGSLVVLVGGSDEFEELAPVLEALGEVRRIGALGSAARLKLVSNSMLAVVSVAGAELLAAGAAAQLEHDDVFWILQRFAPYLKTREAGFVRGEFDAVSFALRDMVKDLDLALGLFERSQAVTPLLETVREIFGRAGGRFGDLDLSAIVAEYAAPTTKQPRAD